MLHQTAPGFHQSLLETRERLRFPRGGGRFAPQPPVGARPVVTYNDTVSFHFNGAEVRAFLAPPAHTDGDTFVYFPDSDVLHLGDVFRTTSYPIIDVYNGGTLAGTIDALRMAIDMAGPETKVIPGHGLHIVGRDAMVEFLEMIVDVRDQVQTMIADGQTLDQVMAARPTAEYDAVSHGDRKPRGLSTISCRSCTTSWAGARSTFHEAGTVDEASSCLILVQNWFQELLERVPVP